MIRDREAFAKQAAAIVGAQNALTDEPMRLHTTFRVGGPADLFLIPRNEEEVVSLLRLCRGEDVPYRILGNGSNLLVSDKGLREAVILIDRNLQEVTRNGRVIDAQAGALLSAVSSQAAAGSLAGLEFAGGIPGTVGGAVTMNAGAYGGEISDVLACARVADEDLCVAEIPASELELGYRASAVQSRSLVVLGARFELNEGDPEEISGRMEEYRAARAEKQPLQYPSAGSTFKRPPGNFAGKLIMEAGLAGESVGDAQVSEKHCGFVINRGKARAADIYRLIRLVQKRVAEHAGVELETEVRIWGEFDDVG